MHIIVASSVPHTEWVLVEGENILEKASTSGINPFSLSRREISHIVRLELPESFFRRRWDHVYYYGPGCSSEGKAKKIEASLVAQFKSPVTVNSDLLAAARGLLIDQPGIAAILATGSNSCYYDGKQIINNVRPGGFLLGDEGSNSYLGKLMLSDILKNIAPADFIDGFFARFDITVPELLDRIYSQPAPELALSEYSVYLAENLSLDYCQELVRKAFSEFIKRNLMFYDFENVPISIVGSTGERYREILIECVEAHGGSIQTIASSAMPGLIKYHSIY